MSAPNGLPLLDSIVVDDLPNAAWETVPATGNAAKRAIPHAPLTKCGASQAGAGIDLNGSLPPPKGWALARSRRRDAGRGHMLEGTGVHLGGQLPGVDEPRYIDCRRTRRRRRRCAGGGQKERGEPRRRPGTGILSARRGLARSPRAAMLSRGRRDRRRRLRRWRHRG